MKTMWIAAPAALVLMSSVALADDVTSQETQTSTTITKQALPDKTYKSESSSSVDANGTTNEQQKTYRSDETGTHVTSSSKTTGADGSQVSVTHEKNVSPDVNTTWRKSTTTTTTTE